MRNLFRIAAILFVSGWSLTSCEKNKTDDGKTEPPVELDNAIEFEGTVTEIRSTFFDMETGALYLVAQEGVTSVGDMSGESFEYVCIVPGDEVETDSDSVVIDIKQAAAGFSIEYCKYGETLLSVSAGNTGAVTEGRLKVTLLSDISAEVDFSMSLVSGGMFRGNAYVSYSDSEDPDVPGYPENSMTFVVDGNESTVGTAAVENYEGYVMFTVTPEPDAGLFNDIYDKDCDYIQLLILPTFLNQDLDVLTESVIIYGYRSSDGTYLAINPEMGRELLDYGYVRIDHEDGTEQYTLYMSLGFTGGTSIGVNATGAMAGEAPSEGSTISVNGDTQPVRAAFYLDMEGYVYLYFTSADIGYFGEIDNAMDYFGVALNGDDLTGNEFDITATDKYFYLFYMDNMTGMMPVATSDDDPLEASGTVSVERSASDPEQFTARISVVFGDGTEVSLDFDGSCLPVDYVPEEPDEFTYMGVTESIQSVLVDKSGGDLWEIWVSATPGLETVTAFEEDGAVHITAPEEAFNSGAVGFSTFKETLKFEYDGKTWQYDGGTTTGTLEVYLDGEQITLDFTTYGDLSGHYAGVAIIVE